MLLRCNNATHCLARSALKLNVSIFCQEASPPWLHDRSSWGRGRLCISCFCWHELYYSAFNWDFVSYCNRLTDWLGRIYYVIINFLIVQGCISIYTFTRRRFLFLSVLGAKAFALLFPILLFHVSVDEFHLNNNNKNLSLSWISSPNQIKLPSEKELPSNIIKDLHLFCEIKKTLILITAPLNSGGTRMFK